MKLKLVGTGSIVGKSRSACSLIDGRILIDCGNGIVKTLSKQGIDISDIEAILITHLHADHFFDLPFFLLTKSFYKIQKTTTIYCPYGTAKIIEHLSDDYVTCKPNSFKKWIVNGNIKFHEFDYLENEKILDDYTATSYLVKHGEMNPVYGYVVKKKDKAIGFSADSTYCKNIDAIISESNIAVLDMSFPESHPTHMGVTDLENICKKYDKKFIATHISDEAREYAKKIKIKNLIIPEDGDEFEV